MGTTAQIQISDKLADFIKNNTPIRVEDFEKDPNITYKDTGVTVLMLACCNIFNGEDVDLQTSEHGTYTYENYGKNIDSYHMDELIKVEGINVDATDSLGNNALLYTLMRYDSDFFHRVKDFLKVTANPFHCNNKGVNALDLLLDDSFFSMHYNSIHSRIKIIYDFFFDKKTIKDTCQKRPDIALFLLKKAINDDTIRMSDFTNIIPELIENGIDINTEDNEGKTLLYYAIISGNKALPDYLIKKGANLTHINKNGDSLLDILSKHLEEEDDELFRVKAEYEEDYECDFNEAYENGELDEDNENVQKAFSLINKIKNINNYMEIIKNAINKENGIEPENNATPSKEEQMQTAMINALTAFTNAVNNMAASQEKMAAALERMSMRFNSEAGTESKTQKRTKKPKQQSSEPSSEPL